MYLDFEKLDSKRQQGFFWFQPLPRGTARALVRVAFLPRCFPFFFWDWGRFLHLIGCRRWVVTHCEVGAQCTTHAIDLWDGWLHLDQNSNSVEYKYFSRTSFFSTRWRWSQWQNTKDEMTYKSSDWVWMIEYEYQQWRSRCLHRLTVLLGIDGWETRTQKRWSKNGF